MQTHEQAHTLEAMWLPFCNVAAQACCERVPADLLLPASPDNASNSVHVKMHSASRVAQTPELNTTIPATELSAPTVIK
jgi:hypothetical protein